MAMEVVHWEPIREMSNLRQAMDRMFEQGFFRPSRFLTEPMAGVDTPIDMYQTGNDVVVKASLPGVKPDEVDISIVGDTVTIKGEHAEEKEVKDKDYLRKERRYGSFSRSMLIPVSVQADKAEAVFQRIFQRLTIMGSDTPALETEATCVWKRVSCEWLHGPFSRAIPAAA
ncbi:MAG: Hsp20/alpha crystallin family protein [Dehalococcoidia bacterium]|nr:Hsp20/alpha crystallin family protein [Dehalococcoidia bacterium]